MSSARMKKRPLQLVAALLLAFGMILAHAGVVIEGTRVIYPSQEREVTVRLVNRGLEPVLMQAWADRGDESSSLQTADAPFLITPPIFRLDPRKGHSIRVIFTGEKLPQDRESLFWLNTLEVPPIPEGAERNFMQVAVRSRLKLFYRPAGIGNDLKNAVESVRWQIVKEGVAYVLRGENTSPHYLSYSHLALTQGGRTYSASGGMIPPYSTQSFALQGFAGNSFEKSTLRYHWINDYGSTPEQTTVLH